MIMNPRREALNSGGLGRCRLGMLWHALWDKSPLMLTAKTIGVMQWLPMRLHESVVLDACLAAQNGGFYEFQRPHIIVCSVHGQ